MVNMDTEKLMMQKRIDNLCEQLELVKRQRDAAIKDITRACGYCKHYVYGKTHLCRSKKPCANISGVNTAWEWRGLCAENGGAEDESMR